MESATVSAALDAYMKQSEQIETRFALAASPTTCAGFLLQLVPQQGGHQGAHADPDIWNRVQTLAATVSKSELLELEDTEILHRLFHQEDVRLMPERAVSFVCRCSKERVAGVLRVLGRDEISGLLADRRTIDVNCDFCGQRFAFSAEEAWAALSN